MTDNRINAGPWILLLFATLPSQFRLRLGLTMLHVVSHLFMLLQTPTLEGNYGRIYQLYL